MLEMLNKRRDELCEQKKLMEMNLTRLKKQEMILIPQIQQLQGQLLEVDNLIKKYNETSQEVAENDEQVEKLD